MLAPQELLWPARSSVGTHSAAEDVPIGHIGGPPLYGRMMRAISSGHTFGNRVRMLKLPLIFAEERLYAGAITQFFWLSEARVRRSNRIATENVLNASLAGERPHSTGNACGRRCSRCS